MSGGFDVTDTSKVTPLDKRGMEYIWVDDEAWTCRPIFIGGSRDPREVEYVRGDLHEALRSYAEMAGRDIKRLREALERIETLNLTAEDEKCKG